jgi:FtsH-binding integral membrane protein
MLTIVISMLTIIISMLMIVIRMRMIVRRHTPRKFLKREHFPKTEVLGKPQGIKTCWHCITDSIYLI